MGKARKWFITAQGLHVALAVIRRERPKSCQIQVTNLITSTDQRISVAKMFFHLPNDYQKSFLAWSTDLVQFV